LAEGWISGRQLDGGFEGSERGEALALGEQHLAPGVEHRLVEVGHGPIEQIIA